jgi:hypothetical protein
MAEVAIVTNALSHGIFTATACRRLKAGVEFYTKEGGCRVGCVGFS